MLQQHKQARDALCLRIGLQPARHPKFDSKLPAVTVDGTAIEHCGFRRGLYPAGGIFEVQKDRRLALPGFVRSEELRIPPLAKNHKVVAA